MLVAAGLVIVSPWALSALDNVGGADWNQLSKVGATYGAISAVIAAIALFGVVASLVIQTREAKAAREQGLRALHADLMQMAMADPVYMECWGSYITENFDTERQFTYINLIISQWHSVYEIGEVTDARLRANAMSLFSGAPGYRYWQAGGSFWKEMYPGRRSQRFYRIIDEAYRETLKKHPVVSRIPGVSDPVQPSRESSKPPRLQPIMTALGFGMAASLVFAVVRRILRRIRTNHH
ncbi:MAG: DUF6082 family protein [Pseudonocardiaceae bacterium]